MASKFSPRVRRVDYGELSPRETRKYWGVTFLVQVWGGPTPGDPEEGSVKMQVDAQSRLGRRTEREIPVEESPNSFASPPRKLPRQKVVRKLIPESTEGEADLNQFTQWQEFTEGRLAEVMASVTELQEVCGNLQEFCGGVAGTRSAEEGVILDLQARLERCLATVGQFDGLRTTFSTQIQQMEGSLTGRMVEAEKEWQRRSDKLREGMEREMKLMVRQCNLFNQQLVREGMAQLREEMLQRLDEKMTPRPQGSPTGSFDVGEVRDMVKVNSKELAGRIDGVDANMRRNLLALQSVVNRQAELTDKKMEWLGKKMIDIERRLMAAEEKNGQDPTLGLQGQLVSEFKGVKEEMQRLEARHQGRQVELEGHMTELRVELGRLTAFSPSVQGAGESPASSRTREEGVEEMRMWRCGVTASSGTPHLATAVPQAPAPHALPFVVEKREGASVPPHQGGDSGWGNSQGITVEKRGFGERVTVVLPSAPMEKVRDNVRSVNVITNSGVGLGGCFSGDCRPRSPGNEQERNCPQVNQPVQRVV